MNSLNLPIPEKVEQQLRLLPATDEGLKLNNHPERGEELVPCEVTHEIVAPDFFPGNTAKLVFYATQNYVTMAHSRPASYGETPLTIYESKESAWRDACFDACFELGLLNRIDDTVTNRIIEKATKLINSLKWWAI
ncbi:hypothetical protein [Microcoleus asticus]|nr:hypothetical protein [Microcoleus asticus]